MSARGDVRPSRTVTSSSSTAPSGTGPGVMGRFLVLAVIGLTFYLSLACTKVCYTIGYKRVGYVEFEVPLLETMRPPPVYSSTGTLVFTYDLHA